jgi:membrane protease YdiL (CAAX protease family)
MSLVVRIDYEWLTVPSLVFAFFLVLSVASSRRAPLRTAAAWLAVHAFVVATLLVGVLLGALISRPDRPGAASAGVSLGQAFASALSAAILSCAAGRLLSARDWRRHLGLRMISPLQLAVWTVVGIGVFLIQTILTNVLGFSEGPAMARATIARSPNALELILTISILVPVAEELTYRGLLLGPAVIHPTSNSSRWAAVVWSGVLWGWMHGVGAGEALLYSAEGILLAVSRLETNSLAAPLVIHASRNACAIALTFALPTG